MSEAAVSRRGGVGDRRILTLAVQALGALAVEPLYVLVDTAIVGRLGTPELGGVALAASALSLVTVGANFLSYGTTEQVARRIGGGDERAAADVGIQAVFLAVLVAAVVTPVLVIGAPTMCRLLGGEGEVLQHAVTYLRISAIGVPFVLVTIAAQGFLRGHSDFASPLRILLAANAANVVLEVTMVFGLGLGVAGSAWSTVIVQVAAAAAFAVVVRDRLGVARRVRPDWASMRPLALAGRHLLLRTGSMLAVLSGGAAVAARIDEPTLAAHQVAMSVMIFVALVLDAFAVPAQTLIAERLGAQDPAGAYALARRVLRLSIISAVFLAVFVVAIAPLLPYAFTSDDAVIDRATVAFVWVGIASLPGAVAFAYDGVLIGAADYRFLGLAALGYLAAMVPVGLVVLRIPQLGISGVWGGIALWMLLRAIVNARRTDDLLAQTAA